MSFQLSARERRHLRSLVRRPRSRKQFYLARALLALDGGHPIETVARMFKVGPDRVEAWVGSYHRDRKLLDQPPGPGAKARWEGPDDDR